MSIEFAFNIEAPDEYDEQTCSARRDFAIAISGEALVSLKEFERIGINLKHEVLWPNDYEDKFSARAMKFPNQIELRDGWLWFVDSMVTIDGHKKVDRQFFSWDSKIENFKSVSLRNLYEKFSEIFDIITGTIFNYCYQDLCISVVPASRTVPTESDLTLLANRVDTEGKLARIGVPVPGSQSYEGLANSFLSSLIPLGSQDAILST